MKAFVLTGFGGPEKLEWHTDWPDPVPGAGEVRVRVTACGVNNTDIWTRTGAYGTGYDAAAVAGPRRTAIRFPRVQGADAVGFVDEVGDDVAADLVGRRVMIDPVVRRSPDDLLTARYIGGDRDGGFAEYVVVPAQNVLEAPEGVADAHAATLATSGGTAMRMLRRGAFADGDRVLVTGASGGVGSAAVQLAARVGCEVTAVTRRMRFAERLRALGASHVIAPGALDVDEAYDGALDVVAGETTPRLLAALRRGGTYVVAGASGGARFTIDVRTVYLGHLSVLGTSLFTSDDVRAVVTLAGAGQFDPLLDRTFPLEHLVDAQRCFVEGAAFGNLAITVA